MEIITVSYEVFHYEELSESAKEEAKRWHLEGKDPYFFKDDCEMQLSEIFPNSKLEVQFSLSSCQGDGLNIYGNVDYNDIYAVIVEGSEKFTEKEKKYIAWFIQEFASDYKYKEKNLPKHGIWASQGTWFVEVPDKYGRKKAQFAREKFWEFADKEKYEIVRVVKDC